MRPIDHRIRLLNYLGEIFRDISSWKPKNFLSESKDLKENLTAILKQNLWFTEESVFLAVSTWGKTLTPFAIREWHSKYSTLNESRSTKSVTVIMAGNIPLVGFHDFICTILSGNRFIGKLSSRDNILFPLILKWIINFDPSWKDYIILTHDIPENPEIIIATGSNNTSRMVNQKYSDKSKIVRHNRTSIGLISGKDTKEDLRKLSLDILAYFGLGCRNVSLLFIPENFEIEKLAEEIRSKEIYLAQPYINNLNYQRAMYGVNRLRFIDAKNILFSKSSELNSPLAMIHYTYYNSQEEVEEFRITFANQIQCVVGNPRNWKDVVPFGESQKPGLSDYADRIDTMDFLITLT